MLMPTRHLMTKGLYNARDLGGYPTRDGKVTRFGVFVRSEAPVELPQSDLEYLREYGITASMDFRGTMEIQARPSDLKTCMAYHHKPLFNEAAAAGTSHKHIAITDWGPQYVSMAEDARDWAIEVLAIAAENPGALLYHCTTGKDRTGIMSCYLLAIAGVDIPDIVADYCVSQVYLEPVYEKMRSGALRIGPPPGDNMAPPPGDMPKMDNRFFETPPSAILTLTNYLTEKYGGIVEYLRHIGVPESTMDAIRAKFVED